MVQIMPFCGWRFDLSQVGALSEVIAPSSCRIDEAVQSQLYRQHPCNIVRLICNREEPGDESPSDRIARAHDFLRLWKREGILLPEHEAAYYVVQTSFRWQKEDLVRWSFFGQMRLPAGSTNDGLVVSRHAANRQAVAEKLELRRVCRAGFSPVVALLNGSAENDGSQTMSQFLESCVRQKTPIECILADGTRHRIWPVTEQTTCVDIHNRLSPRSAFVIGDTAEFMAAIGCRDALVAEGVLNDPNAPAHFVLTCLIAHDDPGIRFAPQIYRIDECSRASLHDRLAEKFHCQQVGSDATACEDAAELAGLSDQQPCVAVGSSDGSWMLVSSPKSGTASTSESLIQQITSQILQRSPDECADDCHRLSGYHFESQHLESMIRHADQRSLLIIVPPESPAALTSASRGSVSYQANAFQLVPDIPGGLVISSLDK